ncbi:MULTISPECIES: peptidylprolyl isomerase [Flavobacterium]|uniref:peptidylprolyl isomerase n=1 Tax=Flavobacterium commune TaxID=1306519 RepID=A0A1D9P7F6_9FLAO|nr:MULTISPECIES: peptidylprolyl isomerase [Flavobacterium]AOZ98453.1 peptidylprolyl isomerase [Flavobacterium commune]
MKFRILFLAFFALLTVQAQETSKKAVKKTAAVKEEGIFATINTTKGAIVLQLEFEKTPVTVANFISLAQGKNEFVTDSKLKGKPFFDGLKFHRVISDFMIQGGDPQGTGAGGTGYSFKDEFIPELKFDKGGILAMANSGPKTNGSQFFITHKDTPWLNGKHTIFGHVVEGMDVVNKIAQDDIIKNIIIIQKGALAKKFKAEKVFANYYNNKAEEERKEAEAKAAAEKIQKEKIAALITEKVNNFNSQKATATTTPSGLMYKITQKGSGAKPAAGTTVYFHYSGFFEDGNLFDSSITEVAKIYDKYNEMRFMQGGYNPFPFEIGKKDGMIPGFIEAINLLSFGDKMTAFIPAKLAYGESGAGGVIPPNATLIFELEIFDKQVETK